MDKRDCCFNVDLVACALRESGDLFSTLEYTGVVIGVLSPSLPLGPNYVSAFPLQILTKLERRDPDSNRGHHDFQASPVLRHRVPWVAVECL